MTQIRLENITFGYAENLFDSVTLNIGDRDRIGIVGNNGSGKSTLLKCIAGLIEPNKGRIVKAKSIRPGFIEQDVPDDLKELSLYDVIAAALPEDERDYNLWKVDIALDTFEAPQNIRTKSIKELSGGWQRLALIARVALSEPDILLLDEPTNHLDLEKILVLEKWLNEQMSETPLVAISHDRRFLEHCTNRTLFVRGGRVHDFSYSYERAKMLLEEADHTAASQRNNEIKELRRLQRSAHDLRQIGVNNHSDAALRKSTQISRSADKLESRLTDVHTEARRDISLTSTELRTKRLMSFENTNITSPDGISLFSIKKLELMNGDRIVILGQNGSGKSQFIRHVLAAIKNPETAAKNGIFVSPNLNIGLLDQHLSHLPLKGTLSDYFTSGFGLKSQQTTSALVNAGFPVKDQGTALSKLSHGQRTRVALLGLQMQEPNFFILDEPTNHLDIDGQEQLEAEILRNGAASILISHDRSFVQNIGTKYFVIEKSKLIEIERPDTFYEAIEPEQQSIKKNMKLRSFNP